MESPKNISKNNDNSIDAKEFKYCINKYDFKNILSIPLILNKIFLFSERDDIKSLSLCNKSLYQNYCKQIKTITLIKYPTWISEIKFDKYENIQEFNIEKSMKLFNFANRWKEGVSKLKWSDIINISFLKNNKNIIILRISHIYLI